MAKSSNHTFLTIVAKKDKPQTLADYRPIACANVIYKIIAKILCNRFKDFLPYLISENQSAFIPGRNTGENILLAHELIRDFKKVGKPKMCIKIDLHKTYDRTYREFICYMLHVMSFPTSFIDLIYACISSPTFSVLIEGIPHGFIQSNRGLRQGDPLSPYLFCIAVEYFTLAMEDAILHGKIKPLSRVRPVVSHLLCADDVFWRLPKIMPGKLNIFETIWQLPQVCRRVS